MRILTRVVQRPDHPLVIPRAIKRRPQPRTILQRAWYYRHRHPQQGQYSAPVLRDRPIHSLDRRLRGWRRKTIHLETMAATMGTILTALKRHYLPYLADLSPITSCLRHPVSSLNGVSADLDQTPTCSPVLLPSRHQRCKTGPVLLEKTSKIKSARVLIAGQMKKEQAKNQKLNALSNL